MLLSRGFRPLRTVMCSWSPTLRAQEPLELPSSPWRPETNQQAVEETRMKCHVGGEAKASQLNPAMTKPPVSVQNHEKGVVVMSVPGSVMRGRLAGRPHAPAFILHGPFTCQLLSSLCLPSSALPSSLHPSTPSPSGLPPGSPPECRLFFTP